MSIENFFKKREAEILGYIAVSTGVSRKRWKYYPLIKKKSYISGIRIAWMFITKIANQSKYSTSIELIKDNSQFQNQLRLTKEFSSWHKVTEKDYKSLT